MDLPGIVALLVLLALALELAIRFYMDRRSRHIEAAEAQVRAEALLRELLSDAEYAQLEQCGFLEVRSPSRPTRTYLVPRRPGRVAVHEDGTEIESLCVGPTERLPPGDIVLAHKLMIEADEPEYLRRANHFRYWPTTWSA
jgi:hypothetical protein